MREVTCFLCGTNADAKLLYPSNIRAEDLNREVFSARRLPDRLHGNVYRCTCGLVYANPQVDGEKLKELYLVSSYTYDDEEHFIQKTYQRYLKRLFSVLQKKNASYLDIGCGNGFMLTAAKEVGFTDVWGVEPSTHAIAKADPAIRGNIIQGMFSSETLQGKTFDAISCFQTFDHIPEPMYFVEECFKALNPGGAVLFINHNIGSLQARLLGERCPMIDIEHTYLHTKQTMRDTFSRAGFTGVQTFSVRNDYPLRYWLHLLPMPRSLKEWMIRFFKGNPLGQIIIPLYPGNVGLIARKQ